MPKTTKVDPDEKLAKELIVTLMQMGFSYSEAVVGSLRAVLLPKKRRADG